MKQPCVSVKVFTRFYTFKLLYSLQKTPFSPKWSLHALEHSMTMENLSYAFLLRLEGLKSL